MCVFFEIFNLEFFLFTGGFSTLCVCLDKGLVIEDGI